MEGRRIGGVHMLNIQMEGRRIRGVHMLNIQMKEGRRIGGVHAGPESRVLEGVSWDEARQMQDAQPSNLGK